jgi:hypothetical protein
MAEAAKSLTNAADRPYVQSRRDLALGLFWAALLLLMLFFWVKIKHEETAAWAVWVIGIVGVAALAAAVWQILPLKYLGVPAKDAERKGFFLKQRKLLALVIAGLSVVLFAVMLILGYQVGAAAFPEVSSAVVLSLIGLGSARYILVDPEQGIDTDAILESMNRNRRNVSVGLLIAGGLLFVIGVYMLFRIGERLNAPINIGTLLTGLVILGGGLWLLIAAPEKVNKTSLRGLVLFVGGLSGFFVALAAFWQAVNWQNDILSRGISAWQGEQAWKLWLCIYLELLGLALIFGSFLLGRMDIRVNPTLRRLLYGYNAVLTGLLLLALLIVLNIVVYVQFPNTYNWTEQQGFYSLSDQSKKILNSLTDEPVKVIVVMSQATTEYRDIRNLLENCAVQTPKLSVEYVSPDLQPLRCEELAKDYPKMQQAAGPGAEEDTAAPGLLVVYGEQEGKSKLSSHTFIPAQDLFSSDVIKDPDSGQLVRAKYFSGENVLMTEISYLAANQQKPIIYFTQDMGEYSIKPVIIDRGLPFLVPTLSKFADYLKKQKYEVKTLSWEIAPGKERDPTVAYFKGDLEEKGKIPVDADILIIADPKGTFRNAKEVTEALDDFLNRKGRIILLSNTPTSRAGGEFVDLGLEDWLVRYGVLLNKDCILAYSHDETDIPTHLNARIASVGQSEIIKTYGGQKVDLAKVRSVRVDVSAGGYRAETWLEIPAGVGGEGAWGEPELENVLNYRSYLAQLKSEKFKLAVKLNRDPISVGVTVFKDEQPRIVVLGDATIISNQRLERNDFYRTLLFDMVALMADRPEQVGIEPKKNITFRLDTNNFSMNRSIGLPFSLMLLGVVALGTGMWLTRRR